MKVVPIKEKAYVRIPAEMRRALGLDEGTKVLVEQEGDHLVLRPIRARQHPNGFLGVFKDRVKPDVVPVTCDTIEEAVAADVADRRDQRV